VENLEFVRCFTICFAPRFWNFEKFWNRKWISRWERNSIGIANPQRFCEKL